MSKIDFIGLSKTIEQSKTESAKVDKLKREEMLRTKHKVEKDVLPSNMVGRKNVTAKVKRNTGKGEKRPDGKRTPGVLQTFRMSFEMTKDLDVKFKKYISQEEAKGNKVNKSEVIREGLRIFLAGKVEKDNGGE